MTATEFLKHVREAALTRWHCPSVASDSIRMIRPEVYQEMSQKRVSRVYVPPLYVVASDVVGLDPFEERCPSLYETAQRLDLSLEIAELIRDASDNELGENPTRNMRILDIRVLMVFAICYAKYKDEHTLWGALKIRD